MKKIGKPQPPRFVDENDEGDDGDDGPLVAGGMLRPRRLLFDDYIGHNDDDDGNGYGNYFRTAANTNSSHGGATAMHNKDDATSFSFFHTARISSPPSSPLRQDYQNHGACRSPPQNHETSSVMMVPVAPETRTTPTQGNVIQRGDKLSTGIMGEYSSGKS